jgi:hypothetical protein
MNKYENIFDFYKLKKCIDAKRIHWWNLVTKQTSIPFIEKYIDLLDKDCLEKLSKNPFATEMLGRNVNKISWNHFVNNPNAIHIIDDHFEICINELSCYGKINLIKHPNFVYIIEKHIDLIIDKLLCSSCIPILAMKEIPIYIDLLEQYFLKYPNKLPDSSSYFWSNLVENRFALKIIEKNLDKLNNYSWNILAKNPNAIYLITKNLHKLNEVGWRKLSVNPNAIPILEKNIEKIDWYSVSNNPNGLDLLEKFPEKIMTYSFLDYDNLTVTSPIFELNYEFIKKRCSVYKEELIAVALQPCRIESYLAQGIEFEELEKYI